MKRFGGAHPLKAGVRYGSGAINQTRLVCSQTEKVWACFPLFLT